MSHRTAASALHFATRRGTSQSSTLRQFHRVYSVRFASDPICAVVAASSASQMLRELRAAARVAATCELRLDWLANAAEIERLLAELPAALAEIRADANRAPRKLCIIATLRRRDAGGRFRGTRTEQSKFLKAAAAAGCNWCDIELQSAEKLSAAQRVNLRAAGARLLISFHEFRRTPRNLAAVVARLDRCHGDAIKIATECRKLSDAGRILAIARGRTDVIAIPMGEAGLPGRILGLRLRSALAYGSLMQSTAPGQLSIREMRDVYHADRLDRRTRIFAVIGDPVAHSLSPAIHTAGYRARGHNAIFLAIRVENLRDFVAAIPSFAISGFAVTLPHKEAMLRHLDECDPLAAKIGAVNTVVVKADGRLLGYNTDYDGVVRAVEPHLRLRGSRALIFGAGGAARAAAFALTGCWSNREHLLPPPRAGALARKKFWRREYSPRGVEALHV